MLILINYSEFNLYFEGPCKVIRPPDSFEAVFLGKASNV